MKLGEIDGVKFLAWKSGGVKFWTNSMSAHTQKKGGETGKEGKWSRHEICQKNYTAGFSG